MTHEPRPRPIRSTPFADLYAVIGEPDRKGGWIVRVYRGPLVEWIWFDALGVVAGGHQPFCPALSCGARR